MITINDLGEFNVPEVFDPDANRASVYASLISTEVRKLGKGEPTVQVACGICGKRFVPNKYRRKYCSDKCRHEANLRSWRKQWARRKRK